MSFKKKKLVDTKLTTDLVLHWRCYSETRQVLLQLCYRDACQISKRSDKYRSPLRYLARFVGKTHCPSVNVSPGLINQINWLSTHAVKCYRVDKDIFRKSVIKVILYSTNYNQKVRLNYLYANSTQEKLQSLCEWCQIYFFRGSTLRLLTK